MSEQSFVPDSVLNSNSVLRRMVGAVLAVLKSAASMSWSRTSLFSWQCWAASSIANMYRDIWAGSISSRPSNAMAFRAQSSAFHSVRDGVGEEVSRPRISRVRAKFTATTMIRIPTRTNCILMKIFISRCLYVLYFEAGLEPAPLYTLARGPVSGAYFTQLAFCCTSAAMFSRASCSLGTMFLCSISVSHLF